MTWRDRLTLYTTVESLFVLAWVTLDRRDRRRRGRKFTLDIRKRER